MLCRGWSWWACFALALAVGCHGLCRLVSGGEGLFLVEGAVLEHAVDHVAAASGEADDGGVVVFALSSFAFVVGDGWRVFGGGDERGLP